MRIAGKYPGVATLTKALGSSPAGRGRTPFNDDRQSSCRQSCSETESRTRRPRLARRGRVRMASRICWKYAARWPGVLSARRANTCTAATPSALNPGLVLEQARKAAQEQTTSHQQREGDGQFGDHESRTAAPAVRHPRIATCSRQRTGDPDAGSSPGRSHPTRIVTIRANPLEKSRTRPLTPSVASAGISAGARSTISARRAMGNNQAEETAERGQQQRLGEQLAHQAAAIGPDGAAHGDLAHTCRRVSHQQICGIRHRDHQQQDDGGGQYAERGTQVASEVIAE